MFDNDRGACGPRNERWWVMTGAEPRPAPEKPSAYSLRAELPAVPPCRVGAGPRLRRSRTAGARFCPWRSGSICCRRSLAADPLGLRPARGSPHPGHAAYRSGGSPDAVADGVQPPALARGAAAAGPRPLRLLDPALGRQCQSPRLLGPGALVTDRPSSSSRRGAVIGVGGLRRPHGHPGRGGALDRGRLPRPAWSREAIMGGYAGLGPGATLRAGACFARRQADRALRTHGRAARG